MLDAISGVRPTNMERSGMSIGDKPLKAASCDKKRVRRNSSYIEVAKLIVHANELPKFK